MARKATTAVVNEAALNSDIKNTDKPVTEDKIIQAEPEKESAAKPVIHKKRKIIIT